MTDRSTRPASRRPLLIVIAAAVVVAAVVVVVAVALANRGSSDGKTGGTTPSAGPGASSSSSSAPVGVSSSPIAVTKTGSPAAGIALHVTSMTAVTGKPQGAGELAGPAVRVVLSLTNSGSTSRDLSAVVVNFYGGSANTPEPSVSGPDAFAFPAVLPAGQTVQGAYVFTVPTSERDPVTIVVDLGSGSTPIAFTGSAPA